MNDQTPRQILAKFYTDNHLGDDGGISSPSVKIEISKKFHFYFPNFNARRKAVLKHDIHHLLTEYPTSVAGESEISAWEIGSGCKKYHAAFFIDTSGTMLGIPWNFKNVLKAFSRGRRTKNLYHDMFTNEQALGMTLTELKQNLLIDINPKNTRPTFTDTILFFVFLVFGLIVSILSLVILPFLIFYTLYIILKERKKEKRNK